jgi:hypothetical protein
MKRAAVRSLATAVTVWSALLGCRETGTCVNCGTMVTVVTADADLLVPTFSPTGLAQQIGDLIFLKLADLGLGLNTLGDSGFIPRLARMASPSPLPMPPSRSRSTATRRAHRPRVP